MKKAVITAILGAASMTFLAGCQTEPGPFLPEDTTKYTVESTDKFVLADKYVQHSVTCTGLQEHLTGEGRFEVAANIKNRENRRIQVQVSCVFKNDQGFSTGDETPWQTLILGENTTESVPFISMNDQARKYTIRVRQAR